MFPENEQAESLGMHRVTQGTVQRDPYNLSLETLAINEIKLSDCPDEAFMLILHSQLWIILAVVFLK